MVIMVTPARQNIVFFIVLFLLKIKKRLTQSASFIFFLSTILVGCERRDDATHQRELITGFFKELLIDHGGAYTLFGSKPMTIECLAYYTPEEQLLLQIYLEEHSDLDYVTVDRKFEEGWAEWRKFSHAPLNKKYVFLQRQGKIFDELVFMNVNNMISVIEENRNFFEKICGENFSILEVEQKLRSGDREFLSLLTDDYITLGTVLGYGHQNAVCFEQRNRGSWDDQNPYPPASEDVRKSEYYLDGKPFKLPVFVMFDPEESCELVEKYKKEREEIKARYAGRDFLEVTFSQLTSGT